MLIKTYLYSEKQAQNLEQNLSTSHIKLHYSLPGSSLVPCLTGSWGIVKLWSSHNFLSLLLFLLLLLQHRFCPQTAAFLDKPVPVWSLQGLQGSLCSSIRTTSFPSVFPHLGICRAISHIFSSYLLLFHGFLKYISPLWLRGSAVPWGVSILEPAETSASWVWPCSTWAPASQILEMVLFKMEL